MMKIPALALIVLWCSPQPWAQAPASTPAAENASVAMAKSFLTEMIDLSLSSKSTKGAQTEATQKKVRDLSGKIDLLQLARRSFGSRWVKFKEVDRRDFIASFQHLLEKTVYPQAQKFSAKAEDMQFNKLPGKNNVVQVMGKIEQEKKGDLVQQDMQIDLYIDTHTLKIYDAVIEHELLSANLKRQFNEALKKKTLRDIIQQMKKRVDESTESKSS